MSEDNRHERAAAPPSLLASAAPQRKADDLKILSALQASPAAKPQRSRGPRAAVAVCALAVVGGAAWWHVQGTSADNKPAAAAEVPAPAVLQAPVTSAASAARPAPVTLAEAPAASAAKIENLAVNENAAVSADPAVSTGPDVPAPAVVAAAAVAAPLAALAAEPIASAAAPQAARPAAARSAKPKPGRTQTASAASHKKPATQARKPTKDPDVALLEALVAHVRGGKPAGKSAGKGAPAQGSAQP